MSGVIAYRPTHKGNPMNPVPILAIRPETVLSAFFSARTRAISRFIMRTASCWQFYIVVRSLCLTSPHQAVLASWLICAADTAIIVSLGHYCVPPIWGPGSSNTLRTISSFAPRHVTATCNHGLVRCGFQCAEQNAS